MRKPTSVTQCDEQCPAFSRDELAEIVREGAAQAHKGLRSSRRLYRAVRPSVCGGNAAIHPGGNWMWGVQGEALWEDASLAAQYGEVEDVTRKYTGSVYDS
jgi:hypothetical protein